MPAYIAVVKSEYRNEEGYKDLLKMCEGMGATETSVRGPKIGIIRFEADAEVAASIASLPSITLVEPEEDMQAVPEGDD